MKKNKKNNFKKVLPRSTITLSSEGSFLLPSLPFTTTLAATTDEDDEEEEEEEEEVELLFWTVTASFFPLDGVFLFGSRLGLIPTGKE